MRNFAEHLAKTALLENNGKYSGMDDIASDDVARVRTTIQQDDNASVVQQAHIGDPSDMAEVMLINPRQDNLVRNVDAEMGLQVEANRPQQIVVVGAHWAFCLCHRSRTHSQ